MSKVVHFEIPVDAAERATTFYHGVFGWEIFYSGDDSYLLVRAGEDAEPGANGALVRREGMHRHPVVVTAVADIDEALGRVARYGGKVAQGKLPVPGVGWSAYVFDSEGNIIGLFQPDPGAAA